jgi:hypothetical protein
MEVIPPPPLKALPCYLPILLTRHRIAGHKKIGHGDAMLWVLLTICLCIILCRAHHKCPTWYRHHLQRLSQVLLMTLVHSDACRNAKPYKQEPPYLSTLE